ncbi:twin-arginine translocase TatA/TatE family subunit [Labrys portucalensis]|uniref:Sec-independent protein translocase protein TatA n=1 Tax=Labrys neptuniae TaxID=376174 RepID=A0ABV3PFI1_9HYPH|nr:twin-arginine translocase TatA/TatE family subunit [Labrys neptuniae]MDT3378035.1 twin-arginine translocase TatA/TatE family subunit [Labrys neptuniae]
MGTWGITHWIILAVVVLVLFGGRGKISDLMGDVAKGIKSFKKGMADDEPTTAQQPVKTIDAQAGTTVNPTEQTKAG